MQAQEAGGLKREGMEFEAPGGAMTMEDEDNGGGVFRCVYVKPKSENYSKRKTKNVKKYIRKTRRHWHLGC